MIGRRPEFRIEDLTRMRALYAVRGPRDGRGGVTPQGLYCPAIRYRVSAVMDDADAAMRLGPEDHAKWREAMGLPPWTQKDAGEFARWSDQCPQRGPGLTHARTRRDEPGVCAHCRSRIVR